MEKAMIVDSAASRNVLDDPVPTLQIYCLAALAEKARAANLRHCAEILRRALKPGVVSFDEQQAALSALFYISCLRAYQWSRARGHSDEQAQDVQQEVALRLVKRFRKPYDVLSFEQYLGFIHLTTTRVWVDLYRYETKTSRRGGEAGSALKSSIRTESLEELLETIGFEPASLSSAEVVDNELRLDRCCELLEDPMTREIFVLRFRHGFSREEIASKVNLTIDEVSQRTNHAIRKLARIKEVQEMFESF
jgi:RNA polymerase sigma factor (sigma-70 family)